VKALPNLLSALRLALAPFIFWFLGLGRYGGALILFAAAALTDWLDGFFARRWRVESPLGAILDPIADKVLLSGAYLTLALTRGIPPWIAWIVLGRDVLILAGAGALLAITGKRRAFPPSQWGKISTGFQIGLVLAVLLDVRFAAQALLWMVAAITTWSGIDYARLAFERRYDESNA
jgi:cardiolipin synthase